jgi:hypothetical protein
MILPLNQLQELNLKWLRITKILKNRYITESAVLPPSLTKLTLDSVSLFNNPELFVQTINSHTNLIEYKFVSVSVNFLDPFFKNYPTLKTFEYCDEKVNHSQSLVKIFESNPQLSSLKLSLYISTAV